MLENEERARIWSVKDISYFVFVQNQTQYKPAIIIHSGAYNECREV